MSEKNELRLPELIVFAGPNGSGKSTITRMAKTVGEYINADDIKRVSHTSPYNIIVVRRAVMTHLYFLFPKLCVINLSINNTV